MIKSRWLGFFTSRPQMASGSSRTGELARSIATKCAQACDKGEFESSRWRSVEGKVSLTRLVCISASGSGRVPHILMAGGLVSVMIVRLSGSSGAA